MFLLCMVYCVFFAICGFLKVFFNWKNSTTLFQKHRDSKCHREAVEVIVTLPAITQDIGEQLSKRHMQEKEMNRQMLVKIISCVCFVAEQGLPLRGDGDEENRNLNALLSLSEEDDAAIGAWMKRSVLCYVLGAWYTCTSVVSVGVLSRKRCSVCY